MLYPKNKSDNLNASLFKNPTSEYRGTPFWAWNCRLTPELLTRQIDYLKQMGFGGFHMHSRTGMSTPYLSDEFMDLVKVCVEKARSEEMLAWLYDEDRWPSGAAGGIVTKNPAYRARHLTFTTRPNAAHEINKSGKNISGASGERLKNGKLLAAYAIKLDKTGCLAGSRILSSFDIPAEDETVWYAYLEIAGNSPWYNNQSYVNTLDKKAIDEFIRVTYEAYKEAAGDDFGGVVPAIFTDEPQFTRKTKKGSSFSENDVFIPWTDDLPETFLEACGMNLFEILPEIFWELPGGQVSPGRYQFHNHIAERFANAFADNCGEWCRKNGLMLTGHMMEESTLNSQTAALGEAMRSYRGFDLPGIDILCNSYELSTAKQAQSAVHQYGCEGMLSELYGVTNWDFDFRGHKLQGDWQAALGVTVRVPHLSWVSMAGEAKRDYPASISYQSSWFREYPIIENHFARINTALTRGKPVVRVGVIHPVESFWLMFGPEDLTSAARSQASDNFHKIIEWPIFNHIDFDFISESLLPEQCKEGGAPLNVGEMQYDAMIIPGCQTIRATTAERLKAFTEQGGDLIVMGEAPVYTDALPHGGALDFLNNKNVKHISYEKTALVDALENLREVAIRLEDGTPAEWLITQLRRDGDSRWLFITSGKDPGATDISRAQNTIITLRGLWSPELYDTMTGEIFSLPCEYDGENTILRRTFYIHDSLLLRLTPGTASENLPAAPEIISAPDEGEFFGKVPITLSEPNVLLLDIAEYAFDSGEYHPAEELLRADNHFRRELGLPSRMDHVAQPWVIKKEKPSHKIRLRFTINSEIDVNDALLALEDAEIADICLNGKKIASTVIDWYVDESIKTVALPPLVAGKNILEISLPFGQRTNVEWCYLLGDFGVNVSGTEKTITAPVRELSFGDITRQGLPFYGGTVKYHLTLTGNGEDLLLRAPFYRGALIGVSLDSKRVGSIVFDPYSLKIPAVSKGEHELVLELFGSRINSFGAIHNCDSTLKWFGPNAWRTLGDAWSYEYQLKEMGILKSPVIFKGN